GKSREHLSETPRSLQMGYVPMYAEEAVLILEPYLPPGTRMTSAYRSPQDQLATISNLVRQHNLRHKNDRISLHAEMQPNRPETWLPSLRELRARQYKV